MTIKLELPDEILPSLIEVAVEKNFTEDAQGVSDWLTNFVKGTYVLKAEDNARKSKNIEIQAVREAAEAVVANLS
jgi:hypothetical protein